MPIADEDKGGSHFREHFINSPKRFVSTENPYRINKRLAIQQGTFLCPGDIAYSFVDNLEALRTVVWEGVLLGNLQRVLD